MSDEYELSRLELELKKLRKRIDFYFHCGNWNRRDVFQFYKEEAELKRRIAILKENTKK